MPRMPLYAITGSPTATPQRRDRSTLSFPLGWPLRLPGADPPDVAFAQIRKPKRSMSGPYRIPARAKPLLYHLVCCGVDLADRYFENGRPNMAFSKCDFASCSWRAHFDIR